MTLPPMFHDGCICRSKHTTEILPNYVYSAIPVNKPKSYTYYEVKMYSHVLGELKFQVTKEQYDNLVLDKTYRFSITEEK